MYVIAGTLLGPWLAYTGYITGNDVVRMIIGIGCIGTVAVNLVRIKTFTDELQERSFGRLE